MGDLSGYHTDGISGQLHERKTWAKITDAHAELRHEKKRAKITIKQTRCSRRKLFKKLVPTGYFGSPKYFLSIWEAVG